MLGEQTRPEEWESVQVAVTRALSEVECLRTLDRIRHRADPSTEDLAARRAAIFRLPEALAVVELTRPIVGRASQPFPSLLGTVDAIHLATAIACQDSRRQRLTMATYHVTLATAARASGLEVVGAVG